MATLTKLYTFITRQPVAPIANFNAQFAQLYTFLGPGGSTIHKDGSQAFTNLPNLATPPAAAGNQLVNWGWFRGYVFNITEVDALGFISGTPSDTTLPNQAYQLQAGMQAVVFTNDVGTLTFPVAFSNACMFVQWIPHAPPGNPIGYRPDTHSVTTTTASLRFGTVGSYSNTVTIHYLAWGF